MKKASFFFLCGFSLFLALACNQSFAQDNKQELLKQYAYKMLKTDGLTFNVDYYKKDLFADDTSHKYATVSFLKKGNRVSYIRIIEPASQSELILNNDTTWAVDNHNKSITYLGGRSAVKGSGLFSFFPVGSLIVDTNMFNSEPYWDYLPGKGKTTTVKFNIVNSVPEITHIRHELSIDTLNLYLVKLVDEVTFGETGKQYQETDLSNYHSFSTSEAIEPDYFRTYNKYDAFAEIQSKHPSADKDNLVLNINSMAFKSLDGKSFQLPKNGLIFMDLWYVGCLPCMKAAPVIEEIYQVYNDQIYFYSVNEMDDDVAKIKRFKAKMGISMPVLLGARKDISPVVSDGSYPVFLLLDAATGKVLWTTSGYSLELLNNIKLGLEPFVKK